MHLGDTELFHSATPIGLGYIYTRAKIWKTFRTSSPALSLLCLPGSPDRPPRRQPPPVVGLCRRQRDRLLVARDPLPLVSVAVNRNLRRRCCRSELIAKLGYEFDPLCYSFDSDS